MTSEVELTVEHLGDQGEGVCHLAGYRVFVEGALPGETVQARFFEKKKNYGKAKLASITKKSPHRTDPVCPVFGRCGGCQLMHFSYPEQLVFKQQRIIKALKEVGLYTNELKNWTFGKAAAKSLNQQNCSEASQIQKVEQYKPVQNLRCQSRQTPNLSVHLCIPGVPVAACIPSPQELAYRNKIQLPVDLEGKMGLYAKNSHDLIEIQHCFVHCELGERVFQEMRGILTKFPRFKLKAALIKTAVHTHQVLVVLVTEDAGPPFLKSLAETILKALPEVKGVVQNINASLANVVLSNVFHILAGHGSIEEKLGPLIFNVSPASFFQVNPTQAIQLYEKAVDLAGLKGDETVLDAYCGVGALSLFLAQKAARVIGLESVPQAIEDAKENGRKNGILNATFECGLAEELIQSMPKIDVALLNPPRKGCAPSFLDALASKRPKRIVYISCEPKTLARDLAYLSEKGFEIKEIYPFDMFPQTVHVESLALLEYENLPQ